MSVKTTVSKKDKMIVDIDVLAMSNFEENSILAQHIKIIGQDDTVWWYMITQMGISRVLESLKSAGVFAHRTKQADRGYVSFLSIDKHFNMDRFKHTVFKAFQKWVMENETE